MMIDACLLFGALRFQLVVIVPCVDIVHILKVMYLFIR